MPTEQEKVEAVVERLKATGTLKGETLEAVAKRVKEKREEAERKRRAAQ
jgi:uncharacterized protein YoaH (UPF0181 family)